MTSATQPDYAAIYETLKLSISETVDVCATIGTRTLDSRDTLRSSLPQLPIGEHSSAQFQIARVLGQGGMGVVHLAYQAALGRHVAIKTVPADRTSRDLENALLQEARIMGLVEHPNVVPVHIIGQDDNGRPIIVMKRIDGIGWDRYLDGKQEPETDDQLVFHLTVLLAVCRAISFAHSRGVLHRDIKPENLMIGKFGEVYVLDWGLAVSFGDELPFVPAARHSTSVVGTPAYMAPEMTAGDGDLLGPHTDVYLVGAVLYHVLTGTPPHRGKSLFDVLACSYEGRARPYPESVPAELRSIAERAMALAPQDRFESVDLVREAIERFLTHRNSYTLTENAELRLLGLEALGDDGDRGELHRMFGEARFGFMSALEIWPENAAARAGLERCLLTMIDVELAQENLLGAQVLVAQLTEPHPEVEACIASLEEELEGRSAHLEKIAYDYDENVGLTVKRSVVGTMATMFLIPPIWTYLGGIREVPAWLTWLTTDAAVLTANVWGLAIAPPLLALLIMTLRRLGDHKSSRIFVKGMWLMYCVGFATRTSSIWGDVNLHHAIGAEAAVYGASLMMLGLAIDRRLFQSGVIFALTAIALFAAAGHPVVLFCGGSIVACVSFVFWDSLSLNGIKIRARDR